MSSYHVEKEFYDYAEDIEGVNIHYVWTLPGAAPDWENQRTTRFMPPVRPAFYTTNPAPTQARLRKKVLRLPLQIPDLEKGILTDRYLLHYYFEIFQGGHRHYSPLYTEEIVTGAGVQPLSEETADEAVSS